MPDYSNYISLSESEASAGLAGGVFGAMLGVWIIICIALCILQIATFWRLYTKAGQPGWACLIPIYNVYIML